MTKRSFFEANTSDNPKKKRIVILGGSYNPPHDGHVKGLDSIQKSTNADEAWMWISHNPFKDASDYAPLKDRKDMCEIATQNFPLIKIQDMEQIFPDNRTASCLVMLREMYPETDFIWSFGDDNFASFHTWNDTRFQLRGQAVPDWQYIMAQFSVAVVRRQGYQSASENSLAARYGADLEMDDPQLLSVHRNGWANVEADIPGYSSTEIRNALMAREVNIAGLHADNEQLIYDRGLLGLSESFNAAPRSHGIKNDVRFETFLLLANTMNLVKALTNNTDKFAQHFSKSYDALFEEYKEEQNQIDVADGVSDCVLALSTIASDLGRNSVVPLRGAQTQALIASWVQQAYMYGSLEEKMTSYLTDLAALCVAEGLEKDRAMGVSELVFSAEDRAPLDSALQSNAEILEAYLGKLGCDISAHIDKIMMLYQQESNDIPICNS